MCCYMVLCMPQEKPRSMHFSQLYLIPPSIKRDGQVLSDNLQQFLSVSPLQFILPPLPLAKYSSKHHPGSCRQDPDVAAVHYIYQRTL